MESDEPKIKSKQALKEIELCVNKQYQLLWCTEYVNNGGLVWGLDFCINITSTTLLRIAENTKYVEPLHGRW